MISWVNRFLKLSILFLRNPHNSRWRWARKYTCFMLLFRSITSNYHNRKSFIENRTKNVKNFIIFISTTICDVIQTNSSVTLTKRQTIEKWKIIGCLWWMALRWQIPMLVCSSMFIIHTYNYRHLLPTSQPSATVDHSSFCHNLHRNELLKIKNLSYSKIISMHSIHSVTKQPILQKNH